MVRVGDEPCHGAKNCKWFDLKVGGCWDNVRFIKCDVSIVLLIYVEVLNKAFFEEVLEGD